MEIPLIASSEWEVTEDDQPELDDEVIWDQYNKTTQSTQSKLPLSEGQEIAHHVDTTNNPTLLSDLPDELLLLVFLLLPVPYLVHSCSRVSYLLSNHRC